MENTSNQYKPDELIYNIVDTICIDFPEPKEKKMIQNLLKNCYLIGGKVITDNNTDTDIYYYDKSPQGNNNFRKLETIITNIGITNDDSLNIDLQPPLSSDKYYSINEPNKTLTDHIFSDKKNVFTVKKSLMNMLTHQGLFLTKLAVLNDREAEKDYIMLNTLYDKFNKTIPDEITNAIKEFKLEDNMNKFTNYLMQIK